MPQPASTVTPRIERRLAAIMAADIAGYSRLMGVDEIGTLSALKAHRHERIDPAIARHHGRIVKTTGDGLLVEFASIVDAVACGVAIQRGCWRSMPASTRTGRSSCASASMLATSSSTVTTFLATG